MIDLRATPNAGRYAVVYADPAWHHASRSRKGQTARSPSHHYPTMSLAEICALPVPQIVAKDAHLFLWTTGPHLEQAFKVKPDCVAERICAYATGPRLEMFAREAHAGFDAWGNEVEKFDRDAA